jgi:hypothetical protein
MKRVSRVLACVSVHGKPRGPLPRGVPTPPSLAFQLLPSLLFGETPTTQRARACPLSDNPTRSGALLFLPPLPFCPFFPSSFPAPSSAAPLSLCMYQIPGNGWKAGRRALLASGSRPPQAAQPSASCPPLPLPHTGGGGAVPRRPATPVYPCPWSERPARTCLAAGCRCPPPWGGPGGRPPAGVGGRRLLCLTIRFAFIEHSPPP